MLKKAKIKTLPPKNNEIKIPYKTPVLQRYGSITVLTAGRNGSVADYSTPGSYNSKP